MIKGTMVCSHAENNEAIRLSVDVGCDTIEHGEDLDEETAEKMARKGVILVPTLGLLISWFTDFIPTDDSPRAGKKIRPDAFFQREFDAKPDQKFGQNYAKQVKESFLLAKAKGVEIALGSDTVYEPLTEFGEYGALEFKYLVQCGMTVSEAIKAATLTAAKAIGMSHRIGTVEAGKNADLLVLKKDPTADVEVLYEANNILLTILNGRLAVEEGRLAY